MTFETFLPGLTQHLEEKKGGNIRYVHPTSGFYTAFVLVTGTSKRHLKTLAQGVEDFFRQHNVATRIDGDGSDDWVLVEVGDIAVHLFTKDKRDLYNLEALCVETDKKKMSAQKE